MLDFESYLWGLGSGLAIALTVYALNYLKGKIMAVVDNLNSAVSSLDAVSNTLVSAVDALVSAHAANDDVAVQAAVDKITSIAAALQASVSKAQAAVPAVAVADHAAV